MASITKQLREAVKLGFEKGFTDDQRAKLNRDGLLSNSEQTDILFAHFVCRRHGINKLPAYERPTLETVDQVKKRENEAALLPMKDMLFKKFGGNVQSQTILSPAWCYADQKDDLPLLIPGDEIGDWAENIREHVYYTQFDEMQHQLLRMDIDPATKPTFQFAPPEVEISELAIIPHVGRVRSSAEGLAFVWPDRVGKTSKNMAEFHSRRIVDGKSVAAGTFVRKDRQISEGKHILDGKVSVVGIAGRLCREKTLVGVQTVFRHTYMNVKAGQTTLGWSSFTNYRALFSSRYHDCSPVIIEQFKKARNDYRKKAQAMTQKDPQLIPQLLDTKPCESSKGAKCPKKASGS